MKTLHCVISGKVQGVCFRAWTADQATNLGIKGWVRNLADGRVEVIGQGDEDKLQEFKKRLLTGSPMSQVEHVECNEIEDEQIYTSFEIRR